VAIMTGAEPFSHDGSEIGVLLCHGFTGTPQSMREWGEYLADRGYTSRLPLLPGHGTTWQEMNRTRWADWYSCVDTAFRELHQTCERVVVCGLSMGAALTLQLAQEHGPRISGLILINPAVKIEDPRTVLLPVLKHLVGSLAGVSNDIKREGVTELAYTRTPLKAAHSQFVAWQSIIRDLPEVTQPVLLLRSPQDHVVPASSSALILSRISSRDVTEILLEDSYHVATIDNDAPRIFDESAKFIERTTRT
jgi:carboxylesterase